MNLEKNFFDFIKVRQRIWYRRFILKNKPPWTQDKVLKDYKIINVYRELDKGTIYIIQKLKNTKDRKKILLNIIFYRFFNKYSLYETLGIEPFEEIEDNIKERFKGLKDAGKAIFNDAYIISGNKTKEPKEVYIINILKNLNIKRLIDEIDDAKKPEDSLKVLQQIKNIGPFLAYEIWTDLTYFNFFRQKWTDDDFVNIGPGAEWGISLIYNKKLNKKQNLEKIYHLHKIQKNFLNDIEWKKINYENAFSNRPYLSLRNIEHSLCEFRKYWNLKNGHGKKRRFSY